jgi:hypothetical protein
MYGTKPLKSSRSTIIFFFFFLNGFGIKKKLIKKFAPVGEIKNWPPLFNFQKERCYIFLPGLPDYSWYDIPKWEKYIK